MYVGIGIYPIIRRCRAGDQRNIPIAAGWGSDFSVCIAADLLRRNTMRYLDLGRMFKRLINDAVPLRQVEQFGQLFFRGVGV
jgi:hypothetical protein